MKYFFLILLSILFFSGCGSDSEKVEMKINVVFSDDVDCTTYLADNFEITLFDSNQKKTESKTFQCSADISTFSLFVVKENYYITVALKDSNGNNKSYGSGTADASADVEVDIEMDEYQGGVTFKWGTAFCSKYDIGVLKFTLLTEDEPVSTIVWGKESEIEEYEILCGSGYFEIVNIPTGVKYTSIIDAYRNSSSKRKRIEFTGIPEFKLVTGQDTPVDIDEYKNIVVSDVVIEWDFDSRSIASCADAGVEKVVAEMTSGSFNESFEQPCDDSFSDFEFFDLPAGEYDISVFGSDGSGKVLYEGLETVDIETGSIGKDAIIYEIFIM